MSSLSEFKQFTVQQPNKIYGGVDGTVYGTSVYQGNTSIDVLWDGQTEVQCNAIHKSNDTTSEESLIGERVRERGSF